MDWEKEKISGGEDWHVGTHSPPLAFRKLMGQRKLHAED